MAYRASATEPATRWARHLDKVLRERNWSRVKMFEEVGPALGFGSKSRSAFLPLLEDREPTPAQAAVLREHFGEPAEDSTPTVTVAEDPTLAVLTRIAVALEKLAGISPEDPEPQLSPGDSTVLRSLARSWEVPTTPRADRPEEVAR